MNIQKITNFELTKRQNSYLLLIIFGGYIAFSSIELFHDECSGYRNCYDFDRRMARLYVWDVSWLQNDFRHFVHMGLLVLSDQTFGNYKVLPLVSSVFILIITYQLAFSITKKRIGGIISLLIMMQSSIFLDYDTSVTYPSFWALFLMLSLYLTRTKYYLLSPFVFVLSVLAKSITALFLPGLLLFLLFDNNSKKKITLVSYFIVNSGIVLFLYLSNKINSFLLFNSVNYDQFILGFVSWIWKGFAHDQLTIVFLIVSTTIILTKKIPNGKPILAFCYGIILTSPFLIGFSTYDVWPYRFVPLVCGISIMTALIFTNMERWVSSFLGGPAKKHV